MSYYSPKLSKIDHSFYGRLKGILTDEKINPFVRGGNSRVKNRYSAYGLDTLRQVSAKIPLISSIINTRTDQIRAYCKYTESIDEKGFCFIRKNNITAKQKPFTKNERKQISRLVEFIEGTGIAPSYKREDDFSDWVSYFVRDTYEVDQISTELQYNKYRELVGFQALDPVTIFRASDEVKDCNFIQLYQDRELAHFTHETLLFDHEFKRTQMKFRGYGYSRVEQVLDLAVVLLNGYSHMGDQLTRDRIPKGILEVMGDVDAQTLDSIRNSWESSMTGPGSAFRIPIIPSGGKDGSGLKFQNLSQTNRDMEYHRTMMFVSSIVAAVFSIDLAELGIKTDDSTPMMGESAQPKIQASKYRGLASMLDYLAQHINKILQHLTNDWKFVFVGMEVVDENKKLDIITKKINTYMSIDEVRKEEGLPEFNKDWSVIPSNPVTMQKLQMDSTEKMAEQQAEMQQQAQEQMQMEAGGEEGEIPEQEESEDVENIIDESLESLQDMEKSDVESFFSEF